MSLAYAMVALLILSVAALGVACLVLLVRLLMSTTSPGRAALADGPSVGGPSIATAAVASDPEATVPVTRER